MGGVKYQPLLKHSSHWRRALKIIIKESRCFQFPESVVTSMAKESLRSTKRGSIQVLAVLYEYKVPCTLSNFCSEGKVML